MFKFTVVYLLLLAVLALMGALQTHNDQQLLGQIVILAGVWFVVCFFIAIVRAVRAANRARRLNR